MFGRRPVPGEAFGKLELENTGRKPEASRETESIQKMGKSFEIEGKLKVIEDVQTFSSGFTKREFVVEVEDGNYPQMIKFECVKDRTSLTDGMQVDDTVKVTFDIRGNEYKERFYVNLNAWKLEKLGGAPAQDVTPEYGDEDAPPGIGDPPDGGSVAGDEDDIPF